MVERVRGIEPPYSAWEADVLPLNYTREQAGVYRRHGDASAQETDGTPDCNQQTNSQEPVRAYGPEIAGFSLGRPAPPVLDDCVAIADDHCQAERKGDLLDQETEVQELFHHRECTHPHASGVHASRISLLWTQEGRRAVICGVDTLMGYA